MLQSKSIENETLKHMEISRLLFLRFLWFVHDRTYQYTCNITQFFFRVMKITQFLCAIFVWCNLLLIHNKSNENYL